MNNPHDKLFKSSMSNKQVAREFLREHLPQRVQQLVNFEKVTCMTQSFANDSTFDKYITDVVFQTEIFAQRVLKMGMNLNEIVMLTGLTDRDIQQLSDNRLRETEA